MVTISFAGTSGIDDDWPEEREKLKPVMRMATQTRKPILFT
jgi:hypothetical protein